MNINDPRVALAKSWSAETSSDGHWSDGNPALGQCAVSALIVQDYFGGDSLNIRVATRGQNISHYFNVLNSHIFDFTSSQFDSGAVFSTPQQKLGEYTSTREYCLSFPGTLRRYELLKGKVTKYLRQVPLHTF